MPYYQEATGIIDDSITDAKLANMPEATIKGRALAAGEGDPQNLTGPQVAEIIGPLIGPPSGPAGGDLAGTYPDPTLTLTGVGGGTFGDSGNVPRVTVDPKGRITAIVTTPVGSGPPTGAAGGVLQGTYPNPELVTVVSPGTIGNFDRVPRFTVDATGRVIAYAEVAIAVPFAPPSGPAGGALGGTYPNPGLATNAVTTPTITDGSVTTPKIANGNVTINHIADNAINAPKIVDGNVTSAKIADGNVTNAKLAQMPSAHFKARISPASGAVEDVDANSSLTILAQNTAAKIWNHRPAWDSRTTGDSGLGVATAGLGELEVKGNGTGAAMVMFHRPSAYAAYLGIDTDSVLRYGGYSAGAIARSVQSMPMLALLANPVGSTVCTFNAGNPSLYAGYRILIDYLAISAVNALVIFQVSQDGGTTWAGANQYAWHQMVIAMAPGAPVGFQDAEAHAAGVGYVPLSRRQTYGVGGGYFTAELTLLTPRGAMSNLYWNAVHLDGSNLYYMSVMGNAMISPIDINAFTFWTNVGTFSTGQVRVYGIPRV